MGRRKHFRAFTLIELLLVMVILAVLASVAIPIYLNRTEDARRKATITELGHLKAAVATFEIDNGRLPRQDEGLTALLEPPADVAGTWQGPYLDQMPMDKWGREYHYINPAREGYSPYDIISLGRDGQEGTPDDIDIYTKN